jgi:hypothetical protein
MAVNLTKVRGRLNNIKKKIYYEAPPPLKLLNINDVILEMDKDWFMPISVTSNLAVGAEYWDLYIADVTDGAPLNEIIPLATVAEIEGEQYRILQYTRPRGETKQWYLRLESTGEKE